MAITKMIRCRPHHLWGYWSGPRSGVHNRHPGILYSAFWFLFKIPIL